MPFAPQDFQQLVHEYHVLLRDYGRAHTRCSEQLHVQAQRVEALQAETIRLRAQVIVRDSELAWAREDRALMERAIPGLPERVTLARRVEALVARVQDLMRERQRGAAGAPGAEASGFGSGHASGSTAGGGPTEAAGDRGRDRSEADALESTLRAADLVICQTGCLSHSAYWRVQNHCRRTGKACVLVQRPEALRIMHIHAAADGDSQARLATLQAESPT